MGQGLDEASVKEFFADEIIVSEGVVRKELYKVAEGNVGLYINYGKENEYCLGTVTEGKCFGEISFLCGEPSMYTAVAQDRVKIMKITPDEFETFIGENKQNALDIINNLARGIVNVKWDIMIFMEDLAAYNIEEYWLDEMKQKMYKNMLYFMGTN